MEYFPLYETHKHTYIQLYNNFSKDLVKIVEDNFQDIINFYCMCIRPVLEHSSPVFHHTLPMYLSNNLDRVQKCAISLILLGCSYETTFKQYKLDILYNIRSMLCHKLFDSLASDVHLLKLLPQTHTTKYNLRCTWKYNLPLFHTERFKRSFIPQTCMLSDLK